MSMGTLAVGDLAFDIRAVHFAKGKMWVEAHTAILKQDVNITSIVRIYGNDGALVVEGKMPVQAKGGKGEMLALNYEIGLKI